MESQPRQPAELVSTIQPATSRPAGAVRERFPIPVTAVLILGLLFLYLVRSILPPFVAAIALAYFSSPVVNAIQERLRVRRLLAVAAFYALTLLPLILLAWLLYPTYARETHELMRNAPFIITTFLTDLFGGERIELFGQAISARAAALYLMDTLTRTVGTPSEALHVLSIAIESLLSVFLVVVLVFYFLLDGQRLAEVGFELLPVGQRDRARAVAGEINVVLSRYVRGLVFLVGLMSTATWLGLALLFHLPYALPVAILTGLLEIIPFIGPITAGAIAALIAFAKGGTGLALGVIAFYFLLRQAEDQLVMPNVLGRAVALSPAFIIFAVLAGGAIGGVLGTLLAIPAAAAVKVIFDHWYRTRRQPGYREERALEPEGAADIPPPPSARPDSLDSLPR